MGGGRVTVRDREGWESEECRAKGAPQVQTHGSC